MLSTFTVQIGRTRCAPATHHYILLPEAVTPERRDEQNAGV